MEYKTEQENFWSGEFGNEYIERNNSSEMLGAYLKLWARILKHVNSVKSVIELGANVGINIKALKMLLPKAAFSAVEINQRACERLRLIKGLEVISDSILNLATNKEQGFDLVFTRGVLIHLNPDYLRDVYKTMYKYTNVGGYIVVDEYYNPSPVSIEYRGNKNKLFKRDFAGEIMDMYSNLKLVDYGFTYHRDGEWNEDTNWFLLKKE